MDDEIKNEKKSKKKASKKSVAKSIAKDIVGVIVAKKNDGEMRNKKQMFGKEIMSAIKNEDPIKLVNLMIDAVDACGRIED